MDYTLSDVRIFQNGALRCGDFSFSLVSGLGLRFPAPGVSREYAVFPGFCDVHVHFREPGFSYKETIASGARAAAHGGYTQVCTMPNLNPTPDSLANLQAQLDRIRETACIQVLPYGALTVGEEGRIPAALEEVAPQVIGFSDDGRGIQSESLMRELMERVRGTGRILAAHCEDDRLVRGGCIHAGEYARLHGLPGICSESEWGPIARDLRLAEETGCKYHICHVSTRESVELIRQAKARGVDVTCETAPHYLLLDDSCLEDDGRFKMNPPLRSRADREALLEGLLDGTVDMIATDHAPHSPSEKAGGLSGSKMGVVGLETAFPALYTGLVKPGFLPLTRLVECMTAAPRRRFGLPEAGFCIWDLSDTRLVDPEEFLSLGRSTPFAGQILFGRCMLTVLDGHTPWADPELLKN